MFFEKIVCNNDLINLPINSGSFTTGTPRSLVGSEQSISSPPRIKLSHLDIGRREQSQMNLLCRDLNEINKSIM